MNQYDIDIEWCKLHGCHVIRLNDDDYPSQLSEIPKPPPLLYAQGNLSLLSKQQLAIVGTRNPTITGKETTLQFAKHFAQAGLVITSGLALGIDAFAHQGALAGGGETIAVMGCGLQTIYPKSNINLAREILDKNGLLLSEFPPGLLPIASNFPRRNRIISGLSRGVLIIEAALKSGSLITAKFALEQNREIFAMPGSIHNPLSKGCHHLIKQGAKLVETAEDVLEELGFGRMVPLPINKALPEKLLGFEQQVYSKIGYETTSIDLIMERSGLTAAQVCSILLSLELNEKIKSVPGGYCRLA